MADGDGEGDGQGDGQGGGSQDTVSKDEFQKVKQKKDELLDEVKQEREQRQKLEDRLDQMESKLNEKEKQKNIKEENIEELQEQLEQEKQQAVSEVEEELEKWKQTAEQLLVDNRLNETLDEKGVAAPYKDSLRYELRQDIEVVESDDGELPLEAVAKNGAKKIDISDHVDSVLEQKGAEHFVEAPNNNGGGAGGDSGGGSVNDNPLDKASESFSLTQANEFVRQSNTETVKQKLNQAQDPVPVNEGMLERGM